MCDWLGLDNEVMTCVHLASFPVLHPTYCLVTAVLHATHTTGNDSYVGGLD